AVKTARCGGHRTVHRMEVVGEQDGAERGVVVEVAVAVEFGDRRARGGGEGVRRADVPGGRVRPARDDRRRGFGQRAPAGYVGWLVHRALTFAVTNLLRGTVFHSLPVCDYS